MSRSLLLSLAILALVASSAGAAARTSLVSTGTSRPAAYLGNSIDGARAWFETTGQNPALGDTDDERDIYGRAGDGTLHLLTPGTDNAFVYYGGASEDGSRLWYTSDDVVEETDATFDVFESPWTPGAASLVSIGTPGSDALFGGASWDGAIVWFSTDAPIDPLDTDTAFDVYRRRDGVTTLVSAGTSDQPASFVGTSRDGSRVWWSSEEAIAGTGDDDTASDLYETDALGVTRLLTASVDSNDWQWAGATDDGAHVYFSTHVAVPMTGDADAAADVYEVMPIGVPRLASSGADGADAVYEAASPDGWIVWFSTAAAIAGSGDSDAFVDVYAGTLDGAWLATPGTPTRDVFFRDVDILGSGVIVETIESLVPADTDFLTDVYASAPDGSLALVSAGTPFPAAYLDRAEDGRIWVASNDMIGTGDDDYTLDIFEVGPGGGSIVTQAAHGADAYWNGRSIDGSRIFFSTLGALVPEDADEEMDVYEVVST